MDAQDAVLLKKADPGVRLGDIHRTAVVGETTFGAWRAEQAGLTAPKMRHPKGATDVWPVATLYLEQETPCP